MTEFKVGDKAGSDYPWFSEYQYGIVVSTYGSNVTCDWYRSIFDEPVRATYGQNVLYKLTELPNSYDPVSKPSHYNQDGGIECIDYIKQVLGKEGFVAYCRGNQIKYQHRAMYKGNAVQDLEKAGQYNAWAIETLKGMNDD